MAKARKSSKKTKVKLIYFRKTKKKKRKTKKSLFDKIFG